MGETSVTVESIMDEFFGRREGIVQALTVDLDKFLQQCDSDKSSSGLEDPVGLYGHPNGTWQVQGAPSTCTPKLPATTIGINLGTKDMEHRDWLHLIAAHCDAWLLSVAFFHATHNRFNRSERKRLLGMINALMTIVEVVGKAQNDNEQDDQQNDDEQDDQQNDDEQDDQQDDDEQNEEEQDEDEQEDIRCQTCGLFKYDKNEFWIYCDTCTGWYHGICEYVTRYDAEAIVSYECLACCKTRD